MNPLLKRIVAEKRSFVLPLAVTLLANVAAYGLIVYPLGARSAGAADRAAAASHAGRAAEDELAAARGLVSGKARADEELSAFYEKVLPADLAAARRMTFATLPALARRANVTFLRRTSEVEEVDREGRLGRLTIRMVLEGDYDSVRRFIYQLESAPEFVVIDDVTLIETQGSDELTLTISLSTYFRVKNDGA